MTGQEHYREAEEIVAASKKVSRGSPEDMSLMAEAQVHATLALAATWADFTRTAGVKPKDYREVKP